MKENDIDVNWNKVAASENRNSLHKSIKRMEGKSCERSDCLGGMVNDVYFFVYFGMMKKSMPPISEKLIIANMKNDVD